jgi:hypothetical protein
MGTKKKIVFAFPSAKFVDVAISHIRSLTLAAHDKPHSLALVAT